MAQLTLAEPKGLGATHRRDAWWLYPLFTFLGFSAFLVYGTWAAWQDGNFEIRQQLGGHAEFHRANNPPVAPYLSPFYSPLIYDAQSPHAWFQGSDWKQKLGLPSWFPFSAGFLILAFPGLFRFTCYYYRKAYYRAFWADPPGCAVGESRTSYWGENRWPLLIQNAHRYTLYFALLFMVFLTWDALISFWWPVVENSQVVGHKLGMGVGSVIMVVNVALIGCFVFGCNSLRHLVGGKKDCFSCPNNISQVQGGYKRWRFVTYFNERHALWAWLSLFSVGFTDVYIRMCSLGVWKDVRFF